MRLYHAAQNVLLHVVGDASLGEAFEHAGIGVPRPGAGGKRLRDFKRRKYRHGNTSGGLRSTIKNRRDNRLTGLARRGKARRDGTRT